MQIHKKTHIARCASETVEKLRFSDNLCSDYAEHESSESSHTETFSLCKYENRGARPRFSCICAANAISCAMPRGSVSIVKTDFLDKLRRTSQDVRLSLPKRSYSCNLNNSRASAR